MTDTAMTEPPKPLRGFVAVPLPGTVRANVAAAAGELARVLPGVRWSRKVENLHVTIKFLGPVEAARLAVFGDALAESLAAVPRFEIEVRGMGAFPSAREASVLWAGVAEPASDGAGRLGAVAAIVEETAARFGIGERESRPFRGHVTVGRSKLGVDARAALAPFDGRAFGRASVEAAQIFESQLGGDGSTYLLRHTAPLGRGPAAGSPTFPRGAPVGEAHLRSGDGSKIQN